MIIGTGAYATASASTTTRTAAATRTSPSSLRRRQRLRVRLGRPVGSGAARAERRGQRVRDPPARGRGRATRSRASEGRCLRRHAHRGAASRPLPPGRRRVEFGQITMMASPRHVVVVRHGDAVPSPTCAPAWRRTRPGSPRALEPSCTPSSTRWSRPTPGAQRHLRRHRRGRGGRVQPTSRTADPAHLRAQARGARVRSGRSAPGRDPVPALLARPPVLNDELRRYFRSTSTTTCATWSTTSPPTGSS